MLFIFLLIFIRAAAPVSLVRESSTTEKAPFSAQAGIFSNEETGQVFPMAPDTDFEEAKAALKSLRGDSTLISDAKPPSSEPQPPGIEETPENSELLRNSGPSKPNTPAQIDYPTTAAAASYGAIQDNAIESFDSKELPVEQQESSGEQKLTTTAWHADVEFSSPDTEGSGQDELNRSVEKVSGEVGRYPSEERQPTLAEVAPKEQQQSVNGKASIPGYDDASYDGYGQSLISQSTTSLPDSGYDSLPQAPVISDAGYDGVQQNTVLPDQGYDAAPQTTVASDVGYEGAGQNIAPGAGYDVVVQSTTVTDVNYDGAPQSSNYGVLSNTPTYDGVPQYSDSYNADEISKTTAAITDVYSPADQKQLQDFSDAVKGTSDHDQAVQNPSVVKKISGSNDLYQKKKFKEDLASNSAPRKSALIGPPADRAPPRRGAVEGCPEPALCAKNCFVYINENGCQDCQCLWQALACDSDDDCPEAVQYCDLGKCNCRPGLRQDMARSGFCEPDPEFKGPLPPVDLGHFSRRTRRAASNPMESLKKENDVTITADTKTAITDTIQHQKDDPTLSTVIISRSITPAGIAHPPSPPPSSGQISRILIDRSIAGTFPYLPPLQPLPRLINITPSKKTSVKMSEDIKNVDSWNKRKSIRLVEFPISARFIAARSRGVPVLPPLPLGVHPREEELRRHNHFIKRTGR